MNQFWTKLFKPAPISGQAKFTFEELQNLYSVLQRNPVVTEANRALVVETIRSIAEFIIWGDQNEPSIFDFFLENNIMLYLHRVLQQPANRTGDVAKQVLQTLSIIVQNIKSETGIYFLFSNNHINNIVELRFDFDDEEVLGYYISFLKTISLKLNPRTVQFFFDSTDGATTFPLYAEAAKFAHHKEGMVRAGVRTLTLNVYSVNNADIQAFITLPPATGYFGDMANYVAEQIRILDRRLVTAEGFGQQVLSSLDSQIAEVEDMLAYCADILTTGAPALAPIVAQQLWVTLVGPLLLRPLMELGAAKAAQAAAATGAALDPLADVPPSPSSPALDGGSIRPACALYVLERLFQLFAYAPFLHNLLLALLGGATGRLPAPGDSPQRPPLSAQTSMRRSAWAASLLPCRGAVLSVLGGSDPRATAAAVRMLVAATSNRNVAPEVLHAVGLLPSRRREELHEGCRSGACAMCRLDAQQLQAGPPLLLADVGAAALETAAGRPASPACTFVGHLAFPYLDLRAASTSAEQQQPQLSMEERAKALRHLSSDSKQQQQQQQDAGPAPPPDAPLPPPPASSPPADLLGLGDDEEEEDGDGAHASTHYEALAGGTDARHSAVVAPAAEEAPTLSSSHSSDAGAGGLPEAASNPTAAWASGEAVAHPSGDAAAATPGGGSSLADADEGGTRQDSAGEYGELAGHPGSSSLPAEAEEAEQGEEKATPATVVAADAWAAAADDPLFSQPEPSPPTAGLYERPGEEQGNESAPPPALAVARSPGSSARTPSAFFDAPTAALPTAPPLSSPHMEAAASAVQWEEDEDVASATPGAAAAVPPVSSLAAFPPAPAMFAPPEPPPQPCALHSRDTPSPSAPAWVDALFPLLAHPLLPIPALAQLGHLLSQLVPPTLSHPSGTGPAGVPLADRHRRALQGALAAAASGVLEELGHMWCEAIFPLICLEWPLSADALARPNLRMSGDVLVGGPVMYPQNRAKISMGQANPQRLEMGLSSSAISALHAHHNVQRLVALTQIFQLLRGCGVDRDPPLSLVEEMDARLLDVNENQQCELSAGSAIPCIVSFAPGQERRVYFALSGASLTHVAEYTGREATSPGGGAAGLAADGAAAAALLHSSPAVVLADPAPTRLNAGIVLSVAPLLGCDPLVDGNVGKWLHVHVRPSVRGLLRVLRSAAGRKGGVLVAMRQLADGHWVLAFPDAERAANACALVDQAVHKLRALYCEMLNPVLALTADL